MQDHPRKGPRSSYWRGTKTMSYNALIFDFFDVICADPYHAWLRAHGLKNEGPQAAINSAIDLDRISLQQFYAQLGALSGQSAEEVSLEQEASLKIDQAVTELIESLHQTYGLALISNAPSAQLRSILSEHNLEKLFDCIFISGELGVVKPDPQIFHDALQRLHATPASSIFIDDNPLNVSAAEGLGLTGITYTDAAALRDSLRSLGILVPGK